MILPNFATIGFLLNGMAIATPTPAITPNAALAASVAVQNPTQAPIAQASPHPSIDPSIMIFNQNDWHLCKGRIEKAAADGAKRVNIGLTIYEYPKTPEAPNEHYCYRENSGSCTDTDIASSLAYASTLEVCFKAAVNAGLSIAIVPHLDNVYDNTIWRNEFPFDPLKTPKQSLNYYDSLLEPIVNAIDEVVPKETTVDFALEGEMGTTLSTYPTQYLEIMKHIRERLGDRPHFKLGISVNYNKVLGADSFDRKLDRPSIQKLLDSVDFVGISNYCSVDIPVRPTNFMRGMNSMLEELNEHGLKLSTDKEIHFSEVGIGGGDNYGSERKPAKNPLLSARAPYSGIRGRYRRADDPWKTPVMEALRNDYYAGLSEFLSSQTSSHKVTRVFLWSSDSWDVNGIYSPEYRSDTIVDFIKSYNAQ
jgi:hypothetical protein